MGKLEELKMSEMIDISGGENPAYEFGYAVGTAIRRALFIIEITSLFK